TSDATRDVMISAKASIATVLPIPSTAAQAEASQPNPAGQLTASDVQLKDPAQTRDPPPAAQASTPPRQPVASAGLWRADASSADPIALQGVGPRAAPVVVPQQVPAPVAVAPPPQPQARRMDADELATLMKRAKESLAAGDIPVARLLLERAADG